MKKGSETTNLPKQRLLLGILLTSLFMILLSASSLALEVVMEQPASGQTWENTLMKINASTDFNANCTYDVTDGSNHVSATLLGNDTLEHYADNVDITSLPDGSFTINVTCWNSSDAELAFNDTVTGTKDTTPPAITWNDPVMNDILSLGSTVTLNITATVGAGRGIDGSKTDIFDVTDCGGSLGSLTPSCGPGECNFTQTWTVPSTVNVNCTIKANASTSMDAIWNQDEINVSVHPNCGDTISSSITLGLNLEGCSGNGLTIGSSGVVLDCDGFLINGSSDSNSGVIIDSGLSGVVVKDCTISNFSWGAELRTSSNGNKVFNNTILSNGQGAIFVANAVSTTNISENNLTYNLYGFRFVDAGDTGSGNNMIYHNNIYNNILGADAITGGVIEMSYSGEGNYWGHSSCPIFQPGADSAYTNMIDSHPYNETDGWDSHGPTYCSVPNVTLQTPGASPRIYGYFNFSVNVTDLAPVAGVTIWNGTHDQSMNMVGSDPTDAIWWAVVDSTGFSDGIQTLAINATNGGQYNDTEYFTVVVDNTGPVVEIQFPDADNYNTSQTTEDFDYNATDLWLGSGSQGNQYMNCTVYLYNSTGDIVYTVNNGSVPNTTVVGNSMDFSGPGVYQYNVTCYDFAMSNMVMNANDMGNAGSSPTYTITLDTIGPVIQYITLGEPDRFVSGNPANNIITIEANYSDSLTGVAYVTADFSAIPEANVSIVNMTWDTDEWTIDANVSDTSSYEFEGKNITLTAYDYAGNAQVTSPVFEQVILYNMTLMPGDQYGCGNIATGSTDFSLEADWNHIDLLLLIDLNYTTMCGFPPEYVDNQLHRVARFNFSDINLTTESAFQQLGAFMDSIDVDITQDGDFGDTRIYLNSSALTDFNRTAVLTLYGLPFDSIPDIIADVGAAGVNESLVTTTYELYTVLGVLFGNLTFAVNGFSGYNVSDTVAPLITINSPAPNQTKTAGPNVLINVTVNGTGTQVSNVTVYVDGSPYYMNNMVCFNATGSELMNCYFNTNTLADGTHGMGVYAWDYGGVAPGNVNSTTWEFTSDGTAPVITSANKNVTGGKGTTAVMLNVSVTDATNVSTVTIGNGTLLSATEISAGLWQVNTTPDSIGCATGTCVLFVNATDYWGNSNYTTLAGFTLEVDNSGPAVTATVNASLSTTNVTPATWINFTVNAPDVGNAGTVNVTMKATGAVVQLSNVGGNVWFVLKTPNDLGCSADATCTITFNATDSYGNSNTTVTHDIYVDATAPAVTAVSVNVTEVKIAGYIRVNATVTDASELPYPNVKASNQAMAFVGSHWTATGTAAGFGCGANALCTITINASDEPGNYNDTESVTLTTDDIAPVVDFVYNSTDLIKSSGSVTLNITLVEINTNASVTANGLAMTKQNGNVWSVTDTGTNLGCTASTSACLITFSATDGAGNVGTDTTTIRVDNDNPVVTNPTINVTKAKLADYVRIRATVTDVPAGIATVEINTETFYNVEGDIWERNDTGSSYTCAPNALCTLTFDATDNVGNLNDTVTISYLIDDLIQTVPSDFTATAGSTSATVSSSSFSENVKCTAIYGTNESVLGSTVDSSAFSATGAVVISGLSASTTYYYNITQCWDEAGNLDTTEQGPFNFTTTAAPSGGGGGGGGGSGSYTTTYSSGDLTNGEGFWELSRGDIVNFRHEYEDHIIRMKTVTDTYVVLEVLSEPQEVTLYEGQSADVDLTGDDKADIVITLMDIVSYRAKLKVVSKAESYLDRIVLLPPAKPKREVAEAPAEGMVEQTAGAETAPEQAAPMTLPAQQQENVVETIPAEKNNAGLVLTLVVVLLVVAGLLALYFKKRRETY